MTCCIPVAGFRRSCLLLLPLLLAAFTAFSQPLGTDTVAQVDKLFAHLNERTPGGVLQLTRNGKTIYHKAFGMANLETATPNTPETIFEAGSVSKQFTAASVLLLAEDGKIKLDDPVTKYFPDFPAYGQRIMIDHLLHHTSGLRDWGSVAEIGGWPRTTRVYNHALVHAIIWRQTGTNFPPGTRYGYSNSNYSLLVFLVEKISGMTLQAFTESRLFRPLGMAHTRWRDNHREIIPGRAQAYVGQAGRYYLLMPFENTFGHAALLTTTEDLGKWNQRWQDAGLGINVNRMQKEKYRLSNGKSINYARGVVSTTYNGFEEISHSGATAGYRAWLAYYPEKSLSVAYLGNDGSTDPVDIGVGVASIFLGREMAKPQKPIPPSVPQDTVKARAAAGTYRSVDGTDILDFTWKGGALRLSDRDLALSPAGPGHFHAEGFDYFFTGKGTSPVSLVVDNPAGDTSTYVRVPPMPGGAASLKAYEGAFRSDEADVSITVRYRDGKLWIHREGENPIPLEPAYKDCFFSPGIGRFNFQRENNVITGFGWSVSRAQDVWFRKTR